MFVISVVILDRQCLAAALEPEVRKIQTHNWEGRPKSTFNLPDTCLKQLGKFIFAWAIGCLRKWPATTGLPVTGH